MEGPSKKEPALVTGRTEQGKLVHFRPAGPLRRGSYAEVEITGAGPHHLMGELRRGHGRAVAPHPDPGAGWVTLACRP